MTAYRQRHVGRSLYLSRAAQNRFALRAVGGVWRLAAVGIIYLLTIRLPRRRKRLKQRDGQGTLVSGTTHRHDHHR